jgi:hypothetical protein
MIYLFLKEKTSDFFYCTFYAHWYDSEDSTEARLEISLVSFPSPFLRKPQECTSWSGHAKWCPCHCKKHGQALAQDWDKPFKRS